MQVILAINPGSTSTKLALLTQDQIIVQETMSHEVEDLAKFDSILSQLPYREQMVQLWLDMHLKDDTIAAVVGRGGMLKPLHSGVYRVNEAMKQDLRAGTYGLHASNLGGLLADAIASKFRVNSYIVDPVSVDEFAEVARISGLPELPRASMLHALNIRATVFRHAEKEQQNSETLNVVVAHLGGGFSIAAVRNGRFVDVNNANEGGPFSAERAGTLPVYSLVRLCYSGRYTEKEMIKKINGQAGLMAYLGTGDLRVVEQRIREGDAQALSIFEAMAYQICKEIAAMSVPLQGKVDGILLTGGMAHNDRLVRTIEESVGWIGPIYRYPGEDEMRALADGVLRVMNGYETPREY